MIAGYPVLTRQVWDRRIDAPTPILVQITDTGLVHCRPRLMLGMAFLPVTARPRMTISILSRRYRNTTWCEHIHQRRERLGDVQARVVLCGHSHQQHLIQLPDGPLILNPGSVGCPSYDDPGAEPHVSEGGSPHARYAVLTSIGEQVSAELVAISYDWKAAATRADANGRPEWGLRSTNRVVHGQSRPATLHLHRWNRRALLMCARFASSRGVRKTGCRNYSGCRRHC
jgi:hypothetical protein